MPPTNPTHDGNLESRRHRLGLSQEDVAGKLSSLAWELHRREVGVDATTISKWERGVRQPSRYYQHLLAWLFETTPEDLGFSRPGARANTQESEPEDRSPAEPGPQRTAAHPCSAEQAPVLPTPEGSGLARLGPVRDALSSYPGFDVAPGPTLTLDEARQLSDDVHQCYQAAHYARAANLLPGLIRGVDALVAGEGRSPPRAALAIQSGVYVVTAKLVTKVGDPQLAWLAADRAASAAQRVDDPLCIAAAAYQVVCAFLKGGQVGEAERIAVTACENLPDVTPLGLSLRGALMLIGSIIAARRNDRREAAERLHRAQGLAESLGRDANRAWTAFGPTNVQIHAVSVAVALGDVNDVIARAEHVDTTRLPAGLLSRRAQVQIDCAWAYPQCRQDAASVSNLLEAERVAPEVLRHNPVVRDLLRQMLQRERRAATPGLRALTQRAAALR